MPDVTTARPTAGVDRAVAARALEEQLGQMAGWLDLSRVDFAQS